MNQTSQPNIDKEEIEKFNALATDWWNPASKTKMLHRLNPIRLQYIQNHVELKTKKVLDVGCGGGILTESLTQAGALVTGIDVSELMIKIARLHAKQNCLDINYQITSVELLAARQPNTYDIITCMELLEHVPKPSSVLQACATLLKPNGKAFFSTINRNIKSYLTAIIGAEYLLQLLPRGTHRYSKFIRPSELNTWGTHAHLQLRNIKGVRYNLMRDEFVFSNHVDINYLAYFQRIC